MGISEGLKDYLFLSGCRLFGENGDEKFHVEFFLECRTFDCIHVRLLLTLVPIKLSTGLNKFS